MQKNLIATAHFHDENALNLFIVQIQALRTAQKKYEQTQTTADLDNKRLLEKEIDNSIETLVSNINAVFL